MDLRIQDKVIIVTGGSSGIGEGISRCLALEGAIPVIASRDVEPSEKLVAELKVSGKEAYFVQVELSSVQACKNVVDRTLEKYGRIDGLVNNAGINDSVGLESGSPDQFISSLEKNLFHYYNLAHYSLEALKK